jgi:hypothetical protein
VWFLCRKTDLYDFICIKCVLEISTTKSSYDARNFLIAGQEIYWTSAFHPLPSTQNPPLNLIPSQLNPIHMCTPNLFLRFVLVSSSSIQSCILHMHDVMRPQSLLPSFPSAHWGFNSPNCIQCRSWIARTLKLQDWLRLQAYMYVSSFLRYMVLYWKETDRS